MVVKKKTSSKSSKKAPIKKTSSAKKVKKSVSPKKKAVSKKVPTRKATPKKVVKKAAPVKKTVKKTAKKVPAKKAAPKKAVSKKVSSKKVVSKKVVKKSPSKSTSKKAVVKKAAPKKVVKKSAPLKKTLKKSQVSNTKSQIPKQDDAIVAASMNLIKDLNRKVDSVEALKSKLEGDVKSLHQKIQSHEKVSPKQPAPIDVTALKKQLLSEVDVHISSLEGDSLKSMVSQEVEKCVDEHFQKVVSDLSSQNKDGASKRIDELEKRIVKALKDNVSLSKQFETINQDVVKSTEQFVKELLKETESKFNSDLLAVSKREADDSFEMKGDIASLKDDLSMYVEQVQSLSKQAGDILTHDEFDVSSLTSKVQKLEKEQQSFLSLIEKYEDELYNRKKDETFEVEKKVENIVKDAEDKFQAIVFERSKNEEIIADKINEIVEGIHEFEERLKGVEGAHVQDVEERIAQAKEDFLKDLDNLTSEKIKERDYLVTKVNELVDVFENLKAENTQRFEAFREESSAEFKEEISSGLLANNEHLTLLSTELKENSRNIQEKVESKLFSLEEQFSSDFKTHIKEFDEHLQQKESEFLNKLQVVSEEKDNAINELHSFKTEIASLTKEYVDQCNDELAKVKKEEVSFDKHVKALETKVDDIINVKIIDMENRAENLKQGIGSALEEEKDKFNHHEETFRTVFTEKTKYLHDFLKRRLESIEKKFVEKNVASVKQELDSQFTIIQENSQKVASQQDELIKRFETLEEKDKVLLEGLTIEKERIAREAEERLMSLEKQLNKRFLELDSKFGEFKQVVVEEVEDLMKEVNSIMSKNMSEFDTRISKANFMNAEMKKIVDSSSQIESRVESEIRNLRDDLSDLKLKAEMLSDPSVSTIKEMVSVMSEYEHQLVGLVRTLKQRNLTNPQIKHLLASKGHPIVYVSMVLEHFNSLPKSL